MPRAVATAWETIGTVVGNTSTYEFTFVLKSYRSRVGDLVAVRMDVPGDAPGSRQERIAWGRITAISRFNPFFPQEAAHELTEAAVPLLDTVLSTSRDYLQAEVLILGVTSTSEDEMDRLFPLTYPIQPAAPVLHPPSSSVKRLLGGDQKRKTALQVGTLLSRSDVPVELAADRVVARHMAILAMTGGGKTVAARRILAELIRLRYPIVIFDPHGDYIGLWEACQRGEAIMGDVDVKLFYPHMAMSTENQDIVRTLIAKMTTGLTEPQAEILSDLLGNVQPKAGSSVLDYIAALLQRLEKNVKDAQDKRKIPSFFVVRRSLTTVQDRLEKMELTNERMRTILKDLKFEKLPDPEGRPEGIVRPGQVSILYLSGYDHLTQSTIVSIVMEALFNHRATLSNRIAPFLALVEEAHNFIPSAREGTSETPSLATLRKVITEGRKFGTGLLLVTQRPSRVDETILAQCNSFLVLRLVNPKDQSYVRQVMENLSETDARLLPGFGPGQGLVSGQAVRFPLLVSIRMDKELVSSNLGDEDFLEQAERWKPDAKASTRKKAAAVASELGNGRRTRTRRGKP